LDVVIVKFGEQAVTKKFGEQAVTLEHVFLSTNADMGTWHYYSSQTVVKGTAFCVTLGAVPSSVHGEANCGMAVGLW